MLGTMLGSIGKRRTEEQGVPVLHGTIKLTVIHSVPTDPTL